MSVSLSTKVAAITYSGIMTETTLKNGEETHVLEIRAQEDRAHQWRIGYLSPKGGYWILRCQDLPVVGADRFDFDYENVFHIVAMCQHVRQNGHEFTPEPMKWEDINAA